MLQQHTKLVKTSLDDASNDEVFPITYGSKSPPLLYHGHMFPSRTKSFPKENTIGLRFIQEDGFFVCKHVDSESKQWKNMQGCIVNVNGMEDWHHPVFLNEGQLSLCYSLDEAMELLKQVNTMQNCINCINPISANRVIYMTQEFNSFHNVFRCKDPFLIFMKVQICFDSCILQRS